MTLQRRHMIRLVRLIVIMCLSIVPHRKSGAQVQPNSATTSTVADTVGVAVFDIVGFWEGSFSLDSAWQLPERATARSIRVRMQFSAVGDATPATSSARSVHPGTFEIDFSRRRLRLLSGVGSLPRPPGRFPMPSRLWVKTPAERPIRVYCRQRTLQPAYPAFCSDAVISIRGQSD